MFMPDGADIVVQVPLVTIGVNARAGPAMAPNIAAVISILDFIAQSPVFFWQVKNHPKIRWSGG